MKRIILAALLVLALALASAGLIHWLRPDLDAPAYRAVPPQTGIPQLGSNINYEFLSSSPFEGGRMWVSTFSGTNDWHYYLYDIERKQILGEVLRAHPVFMNRDQSKLLCLQRGPIRQHPLHRRITSFIERISGGRIRPSSVSADEEVFWVLDLKHNSATRIGALTQSRGIASSFQPSPEFRFGYNKPSFGNKPGLFLCDLETKRFRKVVEDGFPAGWWSDTELIIKNLANDFVLYDVLTEKSAPFLSSPQIAEFLETSQIPDADPTKANLFSTWNGRQYVFYLTDTHKKWLATNSFLIRLERPGGALKLMAREFKFEWSDHLDPTATRYAYTGRQAGDRTTGVFLRDLRDNATRILVAPDDAKYFSLPRFYRDGVIYIRDEMLWWIGFDGSNRTCLFPPTTATQ